MYESNALWHFGIKGQKWGLRRFQEADGSLTAQGRERYGVGEAEDRKKRKAEEKERYKRGKQLSEERDNIVWRKRSEILGKDKEYLKAQKDADDADLEYARAKDEHERENAAYHRGHADANVSRRYDKANAKAMKHANEIMTKKYGDKALSDIDHYKVESEKKFNRFFGGTLAALTVAAIGAHIVLTKKHIEL